MAVISGGSAAAVPHQGREAALRRFAHQWLGTRYEWGGASRSGIDCSAYLLRMYRDVFDLELPRTTGQQIGLGIDITVNPRSLGQTLEPGDLIFYVDERGRPNHVVVYLGRDQITHSVSGRGVVIDPLRRVYGRRIVARRFLVPQRAVPGRRAPSGFGPVPAAGPLVSHTIPCPPSFRARRSEVRAYRRRPIIDLTELGDRAICDHRALAAALRAHRGRVAVANAARLEEFAEWLETVDAARGAIDRER